MNENDATELAYKNGFEAGIKSVIGKHKQTNGRLIDANILKEQIKDWYKCITGITSDECEITRDVLCSVIDYILEAPTIDAVPVIRCRKCKHYQEWNDNPPTCRMWTDQWDMPTEPNGYCHYGELKE